MKLKVKILLFIVAVLPKALFADVKVNAIFSNHMVVQRDTKIPVWGWADPNEKVEVTGSWGKTAAVVTGANGRWRVDLQTPKAGGPYTITISGKNKIVINDVLSGEVWLCTGQSNMDFALGKFLNDSREPQYQPLVEHIRNEVANANDDQLRHIEVLQNTSLFEKQTEFKGEWISAVPNQVNKITATGYFFAKELRKRLNVPIGLVECSWGGTRVQPWISEETYMLDKDLKDYFEATRKEINETIKKMDAKDYVDADYEHALAIWKEKGEKGNKPKPTKHPKDDMQLPATLYNGMLNSIIPYAIKGAIWYQGESNGVYMPNEYEDYFTAMINGWRSDWNQGDFSFYWVQLAGCERANDEADKGWATVNDKLRRSLKLPNTGMAVLYDIGEASDIHPHNKMDAGKRLALWALEKDYNKKVDAVSGPLYKSKKVKGNKIQLQFTEVGSGLTVANKHLLNEAVSVNEPLKTFEIVGEDGKWQPAEAKIISKNKIEVWNAAVSNPTNVRYAWAGYPEGANLYNKEGLPAAVFSTEK
ncbi:sialate O-acetylesterase [Mariniflexile fucanivorans]|uniref:Sialate O-acetylesterase n=1 Tax=Mariniflexile fucanivorans TaxID=264023 RepID=A0A4V6NGW6_9FLAO|nr:sialate O-acetylesterase [Mariniflexile fucanivorans]TCL66257.1 sialate O-acetylesterase [Mariniflexile fucanivorans]